MSIIFILFVILIIIIWIFYSDYRSKYELDHTQCFYCKKWMKNGVDKIYIEDGLVWCYYYHLSCWEKQKKRYKEKKNEKIKNRNR